MKKVLIIVVAGVVVLGGGLFGWSRLRQGAVVAPPMTVKVERGPIRQIIPSNGKITSNLDVDIKCKASGEVIYLPYDVSDVVDIHNPLMKLDPVDEDRHVEQAKVSVTMSQARLETAKTNEVVAQRNLVTERMKSDAAMKAAEAKAKDLRAKADRVGELLKRRLAAQEDYETADTAAVAAATDLQVAQANMEDLKTQEKALDLARQAVLLAEAQLRSDQIALDLAVQQRQDTEVRMPENPGMTGDPSTQPASGPATKPVAQAPIKVAASKPSQSATRPAGKKGDKSKDAGAVTKVIDFEPATGPAPDPKWVVTARNIQIGQIVSSGITTVGGGTTVLTVSDLSQIFVLGAVDESDIGKVKVGQKVITSVDAFPGKKFAGRVVRIAVKGVNTSNVVTFEVKILILASDKYLLMPEMTANIEIICDEKSDALLVPADAIVRKGGKSIVTMVDADGTQTEKRIEVGINDGDKAEVLSGVSEGDTIISHKNDLDSKWKGGQNQGQNRPMTPGRMMGGGR